MATIEEIGAVLLADVYGKGFLPANSAQQNFDLLLEKNINAYIENLLISDLVGVMDVAEVKGLSTQAREDYQVLMFPVFELNSIRRSLDPTVDHRIATDSMLKVEQILTTLNLTNYLTNFTSKVKELQSVADLTRLGNIKLALVQEAMTSIGW